MTSQIARVLCLWLGMVLAVTAQADTLRLGSWDRKTDALVIVGEAVLSQAYAELGQPVEFLDFPIRRAMLMMLNGELDGNVFRIAALANEQARLFRVETPVTYTEARAYAINPTSSIGRWSQLSGLRVAYLRGALVVERNLPPDCQRLEASNVSDVFRLLTRGAADIALVLEPQHSKPHPLAVAAGMTRSSEVIERTPMHHYLLEKHRDIGQRLNLVLKRMTASGEMQAVVGKALKSLD